MHCHKILSPGYFDLHKIFSCGQAFRFYKTGENAYEGVAMGRLISVEEKEGELLFQGISQDEFKARWEEYFDLSRDYEKITSHLAADETLKDAALFGSGIRILRQDFFETLITFILSQQNNIPRIKGLVARISEAFGAPFTAAGKTYHAFPDVKTLAGLQKSDLAELGCGYRAAYVLDAAQKVLSGEICEESLRGLETPAAREELLKIRGVGEKVANCVLLFGLSKFDAFPVDVWMKRIVKALYGSEKTFSPAAFGEYAGLAQQYLFFFAREKKIQ